MKLLYFLLPVATLGAVMAQSKRTQPFTEYLPLMLTFDGGSSNYTFDLRADGQSYNTGWSPFQLPYLHPYNPFWTIINYMSSRQHYSCESDQHNNIQRLGVLQLLYYRLQTSRDCKPGWCNCPGSSSSTDCCGVLPADSSTACNMLSSLW
jgi:hypothetical protein